MIVKLYWSIQTELDRKNISAWLDKIRVSSATVELEAELLCYNNKKLSVIFIKKKYAEIVVNLYFNHYWLLHTKISCTMSSGKSLIKILSNLSTSVLLIFEQLMFILVLKSVQLKNCNYIFIFSEKLVSCSVFIVKCMQLFSIRTF